MKKEIIYSLKGIYREDYQIEGYRFGGGEKSGKREFGFCCLH